MKKKKKGEVTIQFIIEIFIVLTIVVFLVDLLFVGFKQFYATNTVNTITRRVAIQGGIYPIPPPNFPGDSKNYLTTNQLYNKVKNDLKNIGINEDEFTLTVEKIDTDGKKSTLKLDNNSIGAIQVNYKGSIYITLTYKYSFSMWSSFVHEKNEKTEQTVKGHAISEFGGW